MFIKKTLDAEGLGHLRSLDSLAREFLQAEDKLEVLRKATETVGSLSGTEREAGDMYLLLMRKSMEKVLPP